MVGIGRLIALSPQNEMNALAVLRYSPEFGRGAAHRIASPQEKDAGIHAKGRGAQEPVLFGKAATYADLTSALGRGGQIRATAIGDELTWDMFLEQHPGAIPLFALDDRGRLQLFQVAVRLAPKKGWQVYALHPAEGSGAKAA